MQAVHLPPGTRPRAANRALWAFGSLFAVSSGVAFCLTLFFVLRPSGQAQSLPSAGKPAIVPDDHPSIQDAVTAARAGDVIKVRPGEYREWVKITRPVVLEAETKGEVVLVAPSDGSPALSVTDTTDVRVSGFVLRHPAGPPAKEDRPPAVELRRSDAAFTDCEITAAAEDGVRCSGEGRVRLERCSVSGNASHGLVSDRGARVDAVGCRFERNGGSGLLAFQGTAHVEATDCRMSANGEHGAEVNRGGKGTFDRCEFAENARAGLFIEGAACDVTVRNGLFRKNRIHGVGIAGGALLRFSDGVVEGNRETGIALHDPAPGCTISGGTFRENGHFGILLEVAEPVEAEISGADCSANRITGIVVKGPADAKLRRNVCVGNDECGMLLLNGASGSVTENRCQRNRLHGIALEAVSDALHLEGNESSGNGGQDLFRK
jgi:nitrous oxidase accessory protein NosD